MNQAPDSHLEKINGLRSIEPRKSSIKKLVVSPSSRNRKYQQNFNAQPPLCEVIIKRPQQPVDISSLQDITIVLEEPRSYTQFEASKADHDDKKCKSENNAADMSYMALLTNKGQGQAYPQLLQRQQSRRNKQTKGLYAVYKVQHYINAFIQRLRRRSQMLSHIPQYNKQMIEQLLLTNHKGHQIEGLWNDQTLSTKLVETLTNILQPYGIIMQLYSLFIQMINILVLIYYPLVFANILEHQFIVLFLITITLGLNITIIWNQPVIEKGEIYRRSKTSFRSRINWEILLSIGQFILPILYLIPNTHNQIWLIIFILISFVYFITKFKLKCQTYLQSQTVKLVLIIMMYIHIVSCFWIQFYDLTNRSNIQVANPYIISLHWTIQLFTNIGTPIQPINESEMVYELIVIVCSNVFRIIILIRIFVLFYQELTSNSKYEHSLFAIQENLKETHITPQLQQRIISYCNFTRKQKYQSKEAQIINKCKESLSDDLQERLQGQLQGNVLKQCNLFNNISINSLKKVTKQLIELDFKPEQVIVRTGAMDDCSVYLIVSGEVVLTFSDGKSQSSILTTLKSKSSFCELSFFTGEPSTLTAVSAGFTKVFKLKRKDYLQIIRQNQTDYVRYNNKQEQYNYIRDRLIFDHDYSAVGLSCLCCESSSHIINNCPNLHYKPDRDRLIAQLIYPSINKRESFRRNIIKWPNSLMNQKYCQIKVGEFLSHNVEWNDLSSENTLPFSENPGSYSQSLNKQTSGTASKPNTSQKQQSQDPYILRQVDKNSNQFYDQDFGDMLQKDESFQQLDSVFFRKQQQPKQTYATAGFGRSESNTVQSNLEAIEEKASDDKSLSAIINSLSDEQAHEHKRRVGPKKYTFMKMSQSIKDQNMNQSRHSARSLTTPPQSCQTISNNQSYKSILQAIKSNVSNSPQVIGKAVSNPQLQKPTKQIEIPVRKRVTSSFDNQMAQEIDDMNQSQQFSKHFSRHASKRKSTKSNTKQLASYQTLLNQMQSQQVMSLFQPFAVQDNPVGADVFWGIKDFEKQCIEYYRYTCEVFLHALKSNKFQNSLHIKLLNCPVDEIPPINKSETKGTIPYKKNQSQTLI